MTVRNNAARMDVAGRCNDGKGVLLPSPRIAKSAVLKDFECFIAISSFTVRAALHEGEDALSFLFSRSWLMPRIILHLTSGELALCLVLFWVSHNDLVCKDLSIGLTVLQHLRIDRKTLPENSRSELESIACANAANPTAKLGHAGRLMMTCTVAVNSNA